MLVARQASNRHTASRSRFERMAERKSQIGLPFRVACPNCTGYMIVHIFQGGGMIPISDFPERPCIICGKTGSRIDPADLEGTARKAWNDPNDQS